MATGFESGYLLDTSVALWASGRTERLSPKYIEALEQGPLCLSVITYWEVAIKAAIGKLDIGSAESWWTEAVKSLGARVLPLNSKHVGVVARLPLLHDDPFDRALIAQAVAEDLTLLSPDWMMTRYRSSGLKLLR